MHKTEQLREILVKELDDYSEKGKMDVGALDVVDKLAHAIKNLDKIIEKESGYSGDRYRHDAQNMPYMNRSGYYSGYDAQNGSSMYSRDMQSVKQELREVMQNCDERTKRRIQDILERM